MADGHVVINALLVGPPVLGQADIAKPIGGVLQLWIELLHVVFGQSEDLFIGVPLTLQVLAVVLANLVAEVVIGDGCAFGHVADVMVASEIFVAGDAFSKHPFVGVMVDVFLLILF